MMIRECYECHTGGHEFYIDMMCRRCAEERLDEQEREIRRLQKEVVRKDGLIAEAHNWVMSIDGSHKDLKDIQRRLLDEGGRE